MHLTATSAVRRGARAVALAGLAGLALAAGSAQARVNFSLGLNFGVPVYSPGLDYGYIGGPAGGAVSVQVGGARHWRHRGHRHQGGYWHQPHGAHWVFVAPSIVVPWNAPVEYAPHPLHQQPEPMVAPNPDPVIYPRQGQDARQTEVDRQDCNRWATTQPAALADARVFQRAVEACMDGRGYSMR